MKMLRRLALRLSPPHRRDWIEGYLAESDHVDGRLRKTLWTLGLLPFVGSMLISQLFRSPRSQAVEKTWTRVLVASSLILLVGGVALIGIWLRTEQPLNMALLGAVLTALAAAAVVMVLKRGKLPDTRFSTLAAAVGALAVGVGSLGFVISVASAAQAGADPEFGPMTAAALVALHGFAMVVTFTGRGESKAHHS